MMLVDADGDDSEGDDDDDDNSDDNDNYMKWFRWKCKDNDFADIYSDKWWCNILSDDDDDC